MTSDYFEVGQRVVSQCYGLCTVRDFLSYDFGNGPKPLVEIGDGSFCYHVSKQDLRPAPVTAADIEAEHMALCHSDGSTCEDGCGGDW